MAAPDIPLDAWWGGRVRPQYIRLFSGDDRTLTFTIRDRAGSTVSITGTYSLKVSLSPTDSAEITKTGAVSGSSVVITLAGSDTADLDGDFHFELTVTETSFSADSVVAFGRLEIREDM